jgi:hypothetical protein
MKYIKRTETVDAFCLGTDLYPWWFRIGVVNKTIRPLEDIANSDPEDVMATIETWFLQKGGDGSAYDIGFTATNGDYLIHRENEVIEVMNAKEFKDLYVPKTFGATIDFTYIPSHIKDDEAWVKGLIGASWVTKLKPGLFKVQFGNEERVREVPYIAKEDLTDPDPGEDPAASTPFQTGYGEKVRERDKPEAKKRWWLF